MAPLPIIVTSEFAFSTKLTLKPDDGWQHQSLLLRLLKVAAWNGLNGDELAYVFGADIFCQEWLLNKPQDLPWRKLRHLLKESNRTLSQAYPPFSLPIGHVQPTGLRGCRQCYQIGFHSALYLIPFLGRCPLHDEPIVDGCPECAYPVPYAITNPIKRTGFKCPNCQIGFFNLQAVVDIPNRQKLPLWRHWLSKLGANHHQEEPVRTTAYIEAYRQWNWHYAEIPKCPIMEGLPSLSNLQSECTEHRMISEEAARRYYRLRRALRHHFSKNDQTRYYSLIRQTWIPSPVPGNANYFGYIFWRFAWERSFARDYTVANWKQRHFPVTIEHWMFSRPLTESGELIDDIHQEMWRSYRRCQWLAQWMLQRGGILLMPSVMKLIIPGLCIRQSNKK